MRTALALGLAESKLPLTIPALNLRWCMLLFYESKKRLPLEAAFFVAYL
jgi:hypothetical protein